VGNRILQPRDDGARAIVAHAVDDDDLMVWNVLGGRYYRVQSTFDERLFVAHGHQHADEGGGCFAHDRARDPGMAAVAASSTRLTTDLNLPLASESMASTVTTSTSTSPRRLRRPSLIAVTASLPKPAAGITLTTTLSRAVCTI